MQVLAWKPLPAHHDPDELFQVIDALKRVSFEEQEVGSLSDAERAELLLLAQKGSWRNSGRANRLVRCETALSQQFELALKRGARSDERQPHRIGASHEGHARPMQRAGDLFHEPVVAVSGNPSCRLPTPFVPRLGSQIADAGILEEPRPAGRTERLVVD